ncbi:hypothetical protein [Xenorhabdus sp. TH1]|uniref:hypothetical protein n=1 Tax=Xenorhabdus sp. TH1 TaxID=3130166 RepID=UPI0030D47900
MSDLTEILTKASDAGYKITPEQAAALSPYIRDHIRRFGRYDVDMTIFPPELNPKPIPIGV